MSLLSRHLEQISFCSESIATLPFPPPKIFTNALLSTPDITSLIRDTEPHERALFSVPPPPPVSTASTPYPSANPSTTNRRQTVFAVTGGEVTTSNANSNRQPRRNTAVAAVLGAELHGEVRRMEGKREGDVDVGVLLRGAERLNAVWEVQGVNRKIERLRERFENVRERNEVLEEKVRGQVRELDRLNRGASEDGDWSENEEAEKGEEEEDESGIEVTDEDLRREEDEIRELERRKRELEERISGMERDLGGLLR